MIWGVGWFGDAYASACMMSYYIRRCDRTTPVVSPSYKTKLITIQCIYYLHSTGPLGYITHLILYYTPTIDAQLNVVLVRIQWDRRQVGPVRHPPTCNCL